MSLKIICGRGGSGKSTYMLSDMSTDGKSIYIVPEQFSFSAEKKLIDSFGVAGLGNPQALSFMRLADLVFSKYGSAEFISDNASFEMLVSYCANSIPPEKLRLFDGLVKKSELAQTASSVITTFKRYGITANNLSHAIEKTSSPLLKKKLEDSLFIYEEYLSALKDAGIYDNHDILSVLANTLSDESCDFLEDKCVFIDQFSDFDPCEYECIRIMLKRAKRVCISLCTDGSEPFDTVNRTYQRLLSIAKKENISIEPEEFLPDAMIGAKPMLKHLEKCYFDDFSAAFAGNDDSISIFCAKNKFSEIHNVAREIVRLIRDKKMRYRDISIIARDAEQYKGIIERIFPFYDIPAFVDRKMPLSGHCITMFITSILDIASKGFTYENIFTYIKSPFSPLSLSEADELENYCLAAGVRPYWWNKPFVAKYGTYSGDDDKRNTLSEDKLQHINTLREKVYEPLSSLITKLKRKSTVSVLCTHLFEFFTQIELEEKIRFYAEELERNGENLYALQTMQVYNILVDIFNDICSVLGEKALTLHEYHTTILAGLKAVEIGTIPISSDCVTIGSIDRIKGHGAKVVFLVGTNSGVFPLAPTSNGLFTDDDKKELEELGIEMPPSLSHKAQSEQLLVYDALTCGGEKLYISYSAADNASNAMMPSEIVERVHSLFPDICFTDDLLKSPDDESIITAKKAVFDALLSHLRASVCESMPLSPAMSGAAHYFSKDEKYAPLLNDAVNMITFSNESVKIDDALLEKALGTDMKTSITRLETYNKCPFSFFAKYLLKLEPKPVFEVSSADSGSFLHNFLDKFSLFVSQSKDANGAPLSWSKVDDSFIKENTPPLLREVLGNVNSNMLEIPRINAMFRRLCRTAEQSVFAIRNHIVKSHFIPLGYEISFDENGNFPPTKITLEDGKTITLRGRIDRADEFSPENSQGRFVRIVDYKSSDKSLSLSDVYHGLQLQLFVYLSNMCENGYKPAGILYCNLSDPVVEVSPRISEEDINKQRLDARRMNGIVLSEEDMLNHMGGNETLSSKKTASYENFNSMFKHLRKLIKQNAQDIYSGYFPIKCSKEACKWCDFMHLCRFELSFDGCSFNDIKSLSDEEVWANLCKEDENNEMD